MEFEILALCPSASFPEQLAASASFTPVKSRKVKSLFSERQEFISLLLVSNGNMFQDAE